MTKEDKELLIKDISARLPYGVKSKNIWVKMGGEMEECTSTIKYIDDDFIIEKEHRQAFHINYVKPILFPLSVINKEIEVNGEKVNIYGIIDNNFEHSFYIENDGDINIEGSDASYIFLNEYKFILDTFHRYHIDYQGLIGKGLAISVFDLPENPYK